MQTDHAERIEMERRKLAAEVNAAPPPADGMTTDEMQKLYIVDGFAAPFVVVRRRSDMQKGTLTFTHSPRRYFDFTPVN